MFYEEGISLHIHQDKLYSNMSSHIREIYHQQKACEYMRDHYQFDKITFNQIDWEASGKAMNLISPSKQQWISKFVSHSLPIARNMVRRTQWSQNYCPRCKQCEETHAHLLLCQHSQSQEIFRTSIDSLSDWLTQQQTPDSFLLEILQLMTEWQQQGRITSDPAVFSLPIQHQLKIGWGHFMEGRITRHITTYMDLHYQRTPIKRTGLKWTSLLIVKIWNLFYWPQWMNRNEFVHKLNEEVIQTRFREELEMETSAIYLSEKPIFLLAKDRYLLEQPLAELISLPDAQLQAWVNQIRVAIIERDRVFLPDRSSSSSRLRNWLHQYQICRKRTVGRNKFRKISPLIRELRKRSTRYNNC